MFRIGITLLAALALAIGAPEHLDAQGRSDQRPSQRDRDRDWERDRRGDNDAWDVIFGRPSDSRSRTRDQGPPFCRNGQGHPVHGRDWCRQKGYDVRGDRGDIIFRSPRRDRRLDQRGLRDVLGDAVYGTVYERSRLLGVRDPLHGTWHAAPGGGQILSIRSGSLVIAELLDQTLDGRVDLFRLRR